MLTDGNYHLHQSFLHCGTLSCACRWHRRNGKWGRAVLFRARKESTERWREFPRWKIAKRDSEIEEAPNACMNFPTKMASRTIALFISPFVSLDSFSAHSRSLSIHIGNVFVHVKYAQRSVHVFVRLVWVKYIAHWDIFVGGTNVQNLSLQKDGTNFGCVIRLFHRKVEATGE